MENNMAEEKEDIKNENSQQEKKELTEAPADFKFMLAEKIGMTQVYDKDGELKAVTVLKTGPCRVIYTRSKDKDGYNAVCLGFEHCKEKNINKPLKGIFEKYNIKPIKYLKEFKIDKIDGFSSGQIVSINNRFNEGDWIDVQGITIGKGFAGGMKRHNFRGQPASHGASDRERAPGGLASRRALGRVLPGQRMAGRLGGEKVTIHKIKIIKSIPEKNLLLVNGSVPGKSGSIVCVSKTVKATPKPQVVQTKAKAKKEAPKAAAKKK